MEVVNRPLIGAGRLWPQNLWLARFFLQGFNSGFARAARRGRKSQHYRSLDANFFNGPKHVIPQQQPFKNCRLGKRAFVSQCSSLLLLKRKRLLSSSKFAQLIRAKGVIIDT